MILSIMGSFMVQCSRCVCVCMCVCVCVCIRGSRRGGVIRVRKEKEYNMKKNMQSTLKLRH